MATTQPQSTQGSDLAIAPPLRRSRRARVSALAHVVDPGHPGTAPYQLLDLSADGLFIADDAGTIAPDSMLRIGLPNIEGDTPVWASAMVLWRGQKSGRDGVGVRLDFDAETAQGLWYGFVDEWVHHESLASLALMRRKTRRTLKRARFQARRTAASGLSPAQGLSPTQKD